MSVLNKTHIKSVVRSQYGKITDELFFARLECLVRLRIKSEVGRLKSVTKWADHESEQHATFGGTLLEPKCWSCRKRKPLSEYPDGRPPCAPCRQR